MNQCTLFIRGIHTCDKDSEEVEKLRVGKTGFCESKSLDIAHLITNSIKMNASSETKSTYLH